MISLSLEWGTGMEKYKRGGLVVGQYVSSVLGERLLSDSGDFVPGGWGPGTWSWVGTGQSLTWLSSSV